MVEDYCITWSMSGLPDEEAATELLTSQKTWLKSFFDEWSFIELVHKTEYGWRAYLEGRKCFTQDSKDGS